jgi:hypothetical protein
VSELKKLAGPSPNCSMADSRQHASLDSSMDQARSVSSSQQLQSTCITGMHRIQSPHSLVDALTISSRDIADWSHIPRNIPRSSYNSSGTPNSPTRPLSMTRIRSQEMMVRRRCAMHSKVLPVNSRCIVLWIWASVSRSASSA